MAVITARYRGTCTACRGAIKPGERIEFGGKGLTKHLTCTASESSEPVFRTCAQGGRCEDYPCCGCDGLHGRDAYQSSDSYGDWDR
jgi:hypothetical protein